MKQIILIMAHKNREQIERLVNYFEGKCDIIIHLDKKGSFTKEDETMLSLLPGVKKVFRKIAVHWAGHSILRCQLLLLKQGLKLSDGRYFHLISGQDYPLKPLDDFLKFFDSENRDFIQGAHLPAPHWDGNTYKRIQHFYFTDWLNLSGEEEVNKMWRFADLQDKWGIRRRIPDQVKHIFGGSTWFTLTRDSAMKVIEYTDKKPSLLKRFKYTFAPDEMYIHTVVRHVNSPEKQIDCNNQRLVIWGRAGDNHPIELSGKQMHEISSTTDFFGRKFNYPTCKPLLNTIDKYLLQKENIIRTSTGAWVTRTLTGHRFDKGLSNAIGEFCKINKVKSVIDFGCGIGSYVIDLRRRNIAAVGYDGNPNTEEFSLLFPELKDYPCEQLDITEEIQFEDTYDMTLCLSVGEYIPSCFEETVWNNLIRSSSKYIIISWGNHDIYDNNIVNPHSEMEIRRKGESSGLIVDELATHILRKNCWTSKHRQSVIVFSK